MFVERITCMFAFYLFFKNIFFSISHIGHCLGIAESGILNFDRCHFFVQGCPDEVYNSTDLYKCMFNW